MTSSTETPPGTPWHRHFFYRKNSLKTTWKLRLGVLALLVLGAATLMLTREFWALRIGQSLVCAEDVTQSDAFLIENFDPRYLVFEQGRTLQEAGVASRAFVPTFTPKTSDEPNGVPQGFVEVMIRISRLQNVEMIPIREIEPISLNAAEQIRDFLKKKQVKSVLVVAPDFRSRRSELVYKTILTPAGITVHCVPVFGTKTVHNWTKSWHGIEEVGLQFGKLWYYRLFVL